MRWSAHQQKTAVALQSIERARRLAAEARLDDAHREEQEAQSSREHADTALGASTNRWSEHLQSGRFDPALSQGLAAVIGEQERALAIALEAQRDCELLVERRRIEWQHVEAVVRSGDALLRRGRRSILRDAEERHAREISESITWKWFKR